MAEPAAPTPDADAEARAQARRRNVDRVVKAEERLGRAEVTLGHAVWEAARMVREVHAIRDDIRKSLGQEALPEVAPLFREPEKPKAARRKRSG